jgi:AbrB family looped-hinge helix DNA binding protein
MAKVTSKYQVTVPKVIAEQYGIHPGDDIQWVPAGEVIRVVPAGKTIEAHEKSSKLRLFDQATERQRRRSITAKSRRLHPNRGWTREDLYGRGRSR